MIKKTHLTNNTLKVFGIIFVLWALIYIPAIGSLELRGQEGRRIYPAVKMVESHDWQDWILPKVWEKDYYKKPPAINWLVAVSFMITGSQTIAVARLTSAFLVLAFAAMILFMPSGWLSFKAKMLAALMFITIGGIIEKGRMIEIEAAYTVFTGAAVLYWLNMYSMKRSSWAVWPACCGFLTFGLLLKGPFILLFFYSVVIIVLLYEKRLRYLFCLAHFAGLFMMFAVVFGWYYLAHIFVESGSVSEQLTHQFFMRFALRRGILLKYARHIIKSLVYFAPWIVFLPALWSRKMIAKIPADSISIYKGLSWGTLLSLLVICFLPSGQARYSLPYVSLAALLFGYALSILSDEMKIEKTTKAILAVFCISGCLSALAGIFLVAADILAVFAVLFAFGAAAAVLYSLPKLDNVVKLALTIAVIVTTFTLQYSAFLTHIINAGDVKRTIAYEIDKLIPPDETLYIYVDRQRIMDFPFYLECPVQYISEPEQISSDITYFLCQEETIDKLRRQHSKICDKESPVLYDFFDSKNGRQLLLKINHDLK